MIAEGRITDESIKSKLYVDEFGLFREKIPSPTDSFCNTRGHQYSDIYRKKTHFDEIKAMGIEELAEFFDKEAFLVPWCDVSCGGVEELPCRQCILKWLKQEVSDA